MKTRGSIILTVLGVLLLSLIALGLLGHVLLHERINGARSGKTWLTEKMYQHLLLYLHRFREKIAAVDLRNYHTPEEDYFNQTEFAPVESGQTTITCDFAVRENSEQSFKKTRILANVEARSRLGPYRWLAELHIILFSGNIPLPMVPFFWQNSSATPSGEMSTTAADIHLQPSLGFYQGRGEAQLDIHGYLCQSFQISSSQLNWITLRLRLGQEAINEPLADGVYLYLLDETVQAVFVQGAVDHIRFFIVNGQQGVEIVRQGEVYRMVYEPGENFCQCWDKGVEEFFEFKQRIVVNGNVTSLSQQGDAAFLPQTSCQLLVAGKVVVRSSLLSAPGGPSLFPLTNLTLMCGFGDIFSQPGRVAEVVVDAGPEATLDVSLVVQGKFENKGQKLNIRGSLFSRDIENHGSVYLSHRSPSSDIGSFFFLEDCCFIFRFLVASIEEAYNE